jgi:hypothetical protein
MAITKAKASVLDIPSIDTVTHLSNGLMSVADKTKLDAIEAGATADQTASEIHDLLITVDGVGTGVDGDLLDGQQGSFYQNADNLDSGTIPAARFNDTSHGNRAGGSLHAVATQSVDGFLLSSDKSKLDAIEAGATADQTPSEILTAIKTVDGAGSALDGDLLDGQQGSFYQNATNITTGTLPAARFNNTSHGSRGGGSLHAVATQSIAGFMSATDKAKLDGLI